MKTGDAKQIQISILKDELAVLRELAEARRALGVLQSAQRHHFCRASASDAQIHGWRIGAAQKRLARALDMAADFGHVAAEVR